MLLHVSSQLHLSCHNAIHAKYCCLDPINQGEKNPLLGGLFTKPTCTVLSDIEAPTILKASLKAASSPATVHEFVSTFVKGALFGMTTLR